MQCNYFVEEQLVFSVSVFCSVEVVTNILHGFRVIMEIIILVYLFLIYCTTMKTLQVNHHSFIPLVQGCLAKVVLLPKYVADLGCDRNIQWSARHQ